MYVHNLQTMPDDIAQKLTDALREGEAPPSVFTAVKHHLYQHLHDMYMNNFTKRFVLCSLSLVCIFHSVVLNVFFSQEYVRYCQWKYLELLTPYLVRCIQYHIVK